MRFVSICSVALAFCFGTQAQSSTSYSLEPSPTNSIGCESHGDHWHCDGPLTSASGSGSAAAQVTSILPPSPTNSIGCEPHGDHWACEAPLTGLNGSAVAQTLPPSPTASTGCEPHGDHWHCDGPATGSSAVATTFGALSSAASITSVASLTANAAYKEAVPGIIVGMLALII